MSGIRIESISKVYPSSRGATTVFDDFSLFLEGARITSLLGPSSCGKTTLLNMISGLDSPSGGAIRLDFDKPARAGYAMQQAPLLPWRTLAENAMLGVEILGGAAPAKYQEVDEYFSQFGLSGCQAHFPDAASGGMRQRVALIRTLAINPQILLLDEPFSGLDFDIKLKVQRELLKFQNANAATILLVTHDIEDAIALSDKIVILSEKPTKVKKEIDVQLGLDHHDPVEARLAPAFRSYFSQIWNDLKYLDEVAS